MPSSKTVWGIDVGQCALKALKLRARDDRLQAVSFDVIEHSKILSQPDADEQQLIRSSLEKFLSRNNIKGSTIVVSVPGQASFTRFIKLPPVEPKKVPEIVRYEARQQIPFNLEDVVWDYQTISPPSAGPREVEVGIFAMKRDIVSDYVSDFLAMKIEPDIVQMAPVALYNFLRHDKREGSGATILIDVGAENTNLVISEGERVWIRPVPIGGNNFTQALCKAFKLSFAKAERLKRHAAESKHARKVFQAMRPVFGDLLTEVQRSIGYYTSLHRDSRIERVVALGNAFRLAGLRKFIGQSLGVEVERIEGFQSLSDSEALSAPLFRENVLSFGVSYGLAIQGLGLSQIQTSLLPAEILSQKLLRRKRPFFVAAAACVLVAVGAFAYDTVKTYGELEPRKGVVENTVNEVREITQANRRWQGEFDEQKQKLREAAKSLDQVRELTADQDYAYNVLRSLWEAIPHDERFHSEAYRTGELSRAALDMIELLEATAHYVPDVRAYSAALGTGASRAEVGPSISVYQPMPPGEEAPPEEDPPPPDGGLLGQPAADEQPGDRPTIAGPVPGLFVRIVGITPKRGGTGYQYINSELIQRLRADPRTVRLSTPAGEEPIAHVELSDTYANRPDFQVYERAAPGRAATEEGGPEGPVIDKSGDFWFEAHWVVHLPAQLRPPAEEEAED